MGKVGESEVYLIFPDIIVRSYKIFLQQQILLPYF
jgi:hypothetical protein